MQFFSRRANLFPLILAVGGMSLGGLTVALIWYYFAPEFTQVGYSPKQPVAYSHRVHARNLGIDCRYCHSNVERSSVATVPPIQTCMNCHAVVKADSVKLASLRSAWDSGDRFEWTRVHKLPEYAYFDHAVHVGAGVGCVECHGRVDEMDQVEQVQPLNMGWCLECHREVRAKQGASRFLRPVSEVTNMGWKRNSSEPLKLPRPLNPAENCTACHR